SLQSSKRARTSSMPGVSPDLRSVISIPPCRSYRRKNDVTSYDNWISCRLTERTRVTPPAAAPANATGPADCSPAARLPTVLVRVPTAATIRPTDTLAATLPGRIPADGYADAPSIPPCSGSPPAWATAAGRGNSLLSIPQSFSLGPACTG